MQDLEYLMNIYSRSISFKLLKLFIQDNVLAKNLKVIRWYFSPIALFHNDQQSVTIFNPDFLEIAIKKRYLLIIRDTLN